MADLTRSAKSGKYWTPYDLLAYNITVVGEDKATFFGNPTLPDPQVDPAILTNLDKPPGQLDKSTRLFFQYLPDASDKFPKIGSSSQSAVDDFAMHLLGLLGYDEPNRVLHQRLNIPFVVCGENVHAKPDICLLDQNDDYILVIHTSQHHGLCTPEPQLIADAIAAFYENTRLRHTFGLQNIQPKVFAGIALESRTSPVFYKIPITSALLISVITAQFPPQQTVVHRLIVPPVPDASIRGSPEAGMKPLANRRVILQCLEAFKQFIQ